MGAVRFTMPLCLEGNHPFPDLPRQPLLAGRFLLTGSALAGHCSAIAQLLLLKATTPSPHGSPRGDRVLIGGTHISQG